jgi:hypothetical protein
MPMRRLVLAAFLCYATLASAEQLTFGLISDTPYTRWERETLPALIDQMNAEDLAFVVHGGDIKNSSGNCSNAYYQTIRDLFSRFRTPMVYVPGDNEWTDCFQGKERYDPEERLDALRQMFMSGEFALGGQTLRLSRQSASEAFPKYRENVHWVAGDVLFVTLNVPGSHNNFYGTTNNTPGQQGPAKEFLQRAKANYQWLQDAFKIARVRKLRGVMLFIHANPGLENPPIGYADFVDQLRRETRTFSGKVVLVHGDTHSQRIDQPLLDEAGQPMRNFTRVENFGSPAFGWIRVRIDANSHEVFHFQPKRWEDLLSAN